MKLASTVFCLFAVSASNALKVREGMWGPGDLKDLQGVLNQILSAHMTPKVHEHAVAVVADIEKNMAAVTSSPNMTKEERNLKVGAAIKEIAGLQADIENAVNPKKVLTDKRAALEKEMKEKEAELAKDEKMVKLLKLKKELAEKQLQLNKLRMMKDAKGNNADDTTAGHELLQKMSSSIADGLKDSKKSDALLADLRKHSEAIKASIARVDAMEKKGESELDAALKVQVPGATSSDAIFKAQPMLLNLKKQAERKFKKVRVVKQRQLHDAESAITSIEKGDLKALQKAYAEMQAEATRAKPII